MEVSVGKPTPKPRLSKPKKIGAEIHEMTPPDDGHDVKCHENNGFNKPTSNLDHHNINKELEELEEKSDRPTVVKNNGETSPKIPTVSFTDDVTINNSSNSNSNLPSPGRNSEPISAVENPEYVTFPLLRPEGSTVRSKKTNSDLIWFSSGVPPPAEFISNQTEKSPEKDQIKSKQRLYPDLDLLLSDNNNFISEEFNNFDANLTVNNILRHSLPPPSSSTSPKDHSKPIQPHNFNGLSKEGSIRRFVDYCRYLRKFSKKL